MGHPVYVCIYIQPKVPASAKIKKILPVASAASTCFRRKPRYLPESNILFFYVHNLKTQESKTHTTPEERHVNPACGPVFCWRIYFAERQREKISLSFLLPGLPVFNLTLSSRGGKKKNYLLCMIKK